MTLYVIEDKYNKVKSITIYQKMIKRVEKILVSANIYIVIQR